MYINMSDSYMYTLCQKKCNFCEAAFLLEKSVCQGIWEGNVKNFRMRSFASHSQDHITKSSKPYVRVSDPGANGQIKVAFLLEKSVTDLPRTQSWEVVMDTSIRAIQDWPESPACLVKLPIFCDRKVHYTTWIIHWFLPCPRQPKMLDWQDSTVEILSS